MSAGPDHREGEDDRPGRCDACGGEHPGQACPGKTGPVPTPVPVASASWTDPLLGMVVGSFQLKRVLGRGGMGAVYLAEHPVIGSRVAVKFLHESMCGDPELVARFYDEARAVNLIGHENIVAIYDLALLPPSRYYIVMEYLEGQQLSALLQHGAPPLDAALSVLLQLADALAAAHARGVIHRDLKPENVFLVERRGNPRFVKLMDFGIAKLAGREEWHRKTTASGLLVGTPEYMAPEQCSSKEVDRRTDVYALGVMAYQLATGKLPFTGRDITEVLLSQIRKAPRPPRELVPALPPALEALILRALAKRPDDRFPDMTAFGAALEDVRRALERPAAEVARTPPPGATVPGARPSPTPVPPSQPRHTLSEPPPTAVTQVTAAPTPTPIPAPTPPPVSVTPHGVAVTVRAPGLDGTLQATAHGRDGVFVLLEGQQPPPLLALVTLEVPGPHGPLRLHGEVVRHVSAADGARWGMPPGFAVQVKDVGPAERAVLARFRTGRTPPPARHPTSALDLDGLEQRAAKGPYELLGLTPAAGFPEIREAARATKAALEQLRPQLPPEAQASRIPELLARVDAALLLLGAPGERLMFDARRGNFHGVAHCVRAGTPPAVIAARRQALIAENPARAAEAAAHHRRAQLAAKLGNAPAARAAYLSALAADPLDLHLHEAYRAFVEKHGE